MWCEQCQSDVATEISADGQQLLCTTCNQPVRKVVAPSLHPETKSAREFLERWAREQQGLAAGFEKSVAPAVNLPEPTSPAKPEPAAAPVAPDSTHQSEHQSESSPASPVSAAPLPETKFEANAAASACDDPADDSPAPPSPGSQKKYRIDAQHDAPAGPLPTRHDRPRRPHHLEKRKPAESASSAIPPTPPPAAPPLTEKSREPRYRLDEAEALAQGPHFDVRTLAPQRTVYPGRSEAMWGQLMAYAGVGLLTVGTVFVLWGYFGEIERYASTGWLMTTAGQMLLLLGIVTLVGGGMQQTTHEVTQTIEHLGGRMIRIEESTDKILKSPQFNRRRRRAAKNGDGDQEAA